MGLWASQSSSSAASPAVIQSALNALMPSSYTPLSVWGDSRCDQNWSKSTNPPAPLSRSWAWWFETLSQCVRMSHLWNQGVGGDSIAQLLARILADTPNIYGVKPSQVPAGVAAVHVGTNSVNAGTPLATMMAQINAVLDYLLGRGFKVMLFCEWPRGDGVSAPGTNGVLTPANQKLMYAYAASLRRIDRRNVALIDVWPRMADPAQSDCRPIAGVLNGDWLHQSCGAGFITGMEMARAAPALGLLRRRSTASQNGDIFDPDMNPAGCLNTNPMLVQGTGGSVSTNASGVCPQGYTLSAAGGLVVAGSFVSVTLPNGDKAKAFRMVVSGKPTGANAKVALRQTGLISKVSVGDTLEANYEVVVADGHVNFSAPTVLIDTGVAATQGYGGLSISGDTQMPASAVQGYYGVPRAADVTLSVLPSSLSFELRPTFTLTGVDSSLTIDILSASMRKK